MSVLTAPLRSEGGVSGWTWEMAGFLGLMFLVSTMNMADRQIIGIVAEPLKREFGLTDTQLGLLGGTAFALVYPPLGLPIARLADRFDRRRVLAVCLALWSAMTMVCGLAPNFWALIGARAGVAAGEAGYAPATHALIAEAVPPARRARAFSVLVLGISAGTLAASAIGGLVAQTYGWRAAFMAIGAPGLFVALSVALWGPRTTPRAASDRGDGMIANVRRLVASPVFSCCVAGSALHLMVAYGQAAFAAAYFVRVHHLSLAIVGVTLGATTAAAGALGAMVGGVVGDRLGARDRRWLAWWPALTVLVAIGAGVPAFLVGDVAVAIASVALAAFLSALYQPSTYALVQSLADPRERATAAALMIFAQNFIGLGLGPLTVGLLSDHLKPVFGVRALGIALASLFLLNLGAAAFYFLAGRFWGKTDAARPIEEAT